MLHYQLDDLKGKTLKEAKNTNTFKDYIFRVIEEDGNSYAITTDMKKNRINVVLNNAKIVDVVGIY